MRPSFKIAVGDKDITGIVADRLLSMTVTDEAGVTSDRLELVLDDRDQRLEIPSSKATIRVSIGYDTLMVDKGTYVVEEIELEGPERKMTIRANATGASKGAGAAKERSWDDTTLGSIARSIASKHGWTPAIDSDLDQIKIEHADQHENDLQFLTRIATENGAVAKVSHGRLVVAKHSAGKTVSGKTLPLISLVATDTTDWSFTSAARGDYQGVKATYHDPKAASRGEAIAGEDSTNTHTLPHTYSSKAAAERAAKSKMDALKRAKDKFTVRSMPGNPLIQSESRVDAKGFRAGVDGVWSVNKVTHTLTADSYTCSIDCDKPIS